MKLIPSLPNGGLCCCPHFFLRVTGHRLWELTAQVSGISEKVGEVKPELVKRLISPVVAVLALV